MSCFKNLKVNFTILGDENENLMNFISFQPFKIIHSLLNNLFYISPYYSILYFFTLSFKSYIHSFLIDWACDVSLFLLNCFSNIFRFFYFSGPLLYKSQTLKSKFLNIISVLICYMISTQTTDTSCLKFSEYRCFFDSKKLKTSLNFSETRINLNFYNFF